ncbi:MAG: hypothetical protein HY746_03440 [Elusimicrobia bacterium]|nr:hypothetical protein [Elusimicrobiota bacterium]
MAILLTTAILLLRFCAVLPASEIDAAGTTSLWLIKCRGLCPPATGVGGYADDLIKRRELCFPALRWKT